MKKEEYRIKSLYITDVNKSHAACYSYISLLTAYLKSHYPIEFFASVLTVQNDEDKRINYMTLLEDQGITVDIPDINISNKDFSPVTSENKILYGFASIKGVGEKAVDTIIEERELNGDYKSLEDFLERTPKKICNKKVIDSLIMAGAFDRFNKNRNELILKSYEIRKVKLKADAPVILAEDYNINVCMQYEIEKLGKSITYKSKWDMTPINTECYIEGYVKSNREITDKNGRLMCFLEIESDLDIIKAVVFSKSYLKIANIVAKYDEPKKVLFVGKKDDKKQLLINKASFLSE